MRIKFSLKNKHKNTTQTATETLAETSTIPVEKKTETAIEAKPEDTVPTVASEPKPATTQTVTATPEPEPEPTIITEPVPSENSENSKNNHNNNDQQPVVVVEKEESEKKKPLNIPKAVGESNQKACHNHFDWLSTKQKQDVLLVFYTMLKTGTIRNTANYFIGLCKLAKVDNLTLPTEVTSKKKRSTKQIAKQQEDEKRRNLWSDYVCIQQFAQREQVDEKVIADRFDMMEAYEMFGQEKQPLAA